MGHKVTIIDRQRPIKMSDYYEMFMRVLSHIRRNTFSWSDFYVNEYPPVLMREIRGFLRRELRKQTITIRKETDLKAIGRDNYDAFIVGSDQTWRPKYVYDVLNYFLDFVPEERKVKRIAYAPSFGTAEWEYSKDIESIAREFVQRFNAVSVREDTGVDLCLNHFGVNAIHVLDPTMLLTEKDYVKFVAKTESVKYIGYNLLDFSKEKLDFVNSIKEKIGMPIRQLISMGDKSKRRIHEKVAPSIEEWLTGIANSELLVVDSFHATVFAIIFHKEFLTIANAARGLSRFTSLLKMAGLENRLVTDFDKFDNNIVNNKIDWSIVDENIQRMRKVSMDFLTSSLQ
jgi:polysaccharide pyruvyl transferase WcaK-like protein